MARGKSRRSRSKSRSKRRKGRRGRQRTKASQTLFLEYHSIPFLRLHRQLSLIGYDASAPPAVRAQFWSLVPPGVYPSEQGRALVLDYSERVEAKLAEVLAEFSVAYWLHVYRRLSPEGIGEQSDPDTVHLVRRTLEAAFQKYGRSEPCHRIGFSNSVPVDTILSGLLQGNEFRVVREQLLARPQLVLTEFGVQELKQFYEVEKLAYEAWRCAAAMRITGKGSPLRSTGDELGFIDERSDELHRLVSSYDGRDESLSASATGTTFIDPLQDGPSGQVVPISFYNARRVKFEVPDLPPMVVPLLMRGLDSFVSSQALPA